MKTQMIDRNTTFALFSSIAALAVAVSVIGPSAFAFALIGLLALSAPLVALWRRSATGVAGPEPKETPHTVVS